MYVDVLTLTRSLVVNVLMMFIVRDRLRRTVNWRCYYWLVRWTLARWRHALPTSCCRAATAVADDDDVDDVVCGDCWHSSWFSWRQVVGTSLERANIHDDVINTDIHYSRRRESREYSDHPRLCVWERVCDSVCLSVCPHDKTKAAETKIAKLGTGKSITVPRPPINIRSKGQRSRSHGAKVQKGDRVAGMS